jgi:hypothetical protein
MICFRRALRPLGTLAAVAAKSISLVLVLRTGEKAFF